MKQSTPSHVFSRYQRHPWDADIQSLLTPFATAPKWSLVLRAFLKLVDVFASLPLLQFLLSPLHFRQVRIKKDTPS